MAESQYSFDATLENFQQEVAQASMSVPVLIYAWADWAEGCQQMTEALENLAEAYRGNFRLARVNVDQNRELAGHLGVQNLPEVKIVKQGQLVDEITQALPEAQIREVLDRHVEPPPESGREKADRLWKEGQLEEAEAVLTTLNQENPDDYDILIDLARIQSEQGKFDSARQILDSLPGEEKLRPAAKQLIARFEFQEQVRDIPPEADLQARLEKDPADVQAMNQLATHRIMAGENEAAMELLLSSVQTEKDFEEGAAKNTLVKLFDLLGNEDPLVRQYRRRLFAMMH